MVVPYRVRRDRMKVTAGHTLDGVEAGKYHLLESAERDHLRANAGREYELSCLGVVANS